MMTENPKLHRFFTVEYKGTIYFRFDTYGPEYTVWMKVDKADQVDNVDVYNFLEMVYKNVDLDIIKECRQTGRTRTTTKNLLEKAYYEQMTEIEKTEGEIKVLQAKLELLKEMENFKSPAEKAYYAVYGWYPPTTSSVSNYEDNRWRDFQNGYNASKVSETPQERGERVHKETEELITKIHDGHRVVEYQPIPQEPEELKTLYQMWNDGECRDDICYLVKSWMSQYEIDRWCDDWDVGFSDCLDKLNKGLK